MSVHLCVGCPTPGRCSAKLECTMHMKVLEHTWSDEDEAALKTLLGRKAEDSRVRREKQLEPLRLAAEYIRNDMNPGEDSMGLSMMHAIEANVPTLLRLLNEFAANTNPAV